MLHAMLAVLSCAVILWPSAVEGGQINPRICVPYDRMRGDLLRKYQEKPHGHGISEDGELMELYVSPGGRTWTIIQIKPQTGLACPRASGTDWFVLTPNGDA